MKRIDKLAKKLYREVLAEYNAQGESADRKAIGELLDEKLSQYNEATKEIIEGKVFDALGKDTKFVSTKFSPLSGTKLSEKLYKNSKKVANESLELLNQGIQAKKPIREISKKLYDGYGFNDKEVLDVKKKLPKYLQRELKRGKVSKELVKYVDKLKTKPLKTALKQIVKKMDDVNKIGLEKVLKVALEEKSRYYATRIADTESHRARNLSRAKEYMEDDDIEFVKFQLSSRHPMTDICDYYANLDVGYGAGIVPKEQMVTLPLHPHCHCRYQPYYKKVKKRRIKNPQVYTMEKFSLRDQQRIAGSFDKLRQFKEGMPIERVFNSVRPEYPIRKYHDVFGYNSGMEKYKEIENNFLSGIDSFETGTKHSAIDTFPSLWMSIKDYERHITKRLYKEKVVIDEWDYIQKTFDALLSSDVYYEAYEDPQLWDRVFYSKENNWAVVVAQNGKILTSYKIKSKIEDTLKKHEEFLKAKISKVGVGDEFKRTIREIVDKLGKL